MEILRVINFAAFDFSIYFNSELYKKEHSKSDYTERLQSSSISKNLFEV